ATGPAPTGQTSTARPSTDGEQTATAQQSVGGQNEAPARTPAPVAAVPAGEPTQLSGAKAAALQEVQSALDSVREAQRSGDFADYGDALQRLDDAMNRYNNAD
ncbi:hypothetical protein, partial [Micromonospora sp. WMMD736]|uniref:hypothetical protein n=1 Tax=Micromonospora sp. WMMD736 TaxID=3404112 RepID=UPI003B937D9A